MLPAKMPLPPQNRQRRQYTLFIERPPEAVFVFFADVKNHLRIAPPEAPEEIIFGQETTLAYGINYRYRVKRNGILQTVEMEVTEWTPFHGFVEEQTAGSLALFIHRHRFAPFQNGTLMTDQIEFASASPLGALTDNLLLGTHFDRLFPLRQNEAKRILERIGRIKGPGL